MTEAQSDTQKKPSGKASRYIMIGGFLGAGKTTAVAQLANVVPARRPVSA